MGYAQEYAHSQPKRHLDQGLLCVGVLQNKGNLHDDPIFRDAIVLYFDLLLFDPGAADVS